jgi:hypothetical protein
MENKKKKGARERRNQKDTKRYKKRRARGKKDSGNMKKEGRE